MTPLRMLGVGLLVVGLVWGLAATAVDYWYYGSVTDTSGESASVYFGLWKLCAKKQGVYACLTWSYLEDQAHEQGAELADGWLHSCQALMIVGVIINATACVFAVSRNPPVQAAQILAFLAGGFYAAAAIVFAINYAKVISEEAHSGTLHVGFGLSVAAGIVSFLPICVLPKAAQIESMLDYQQL